MTTLSHIVVIVVTALLLLGAGIYTIAATAMRPDEARKECAVLAALCWIAAAIWIWGVVL